MPIAVITPQLSTIAERFRANPIALNIAATFQGRPGALRLAPVVCPRRCD
jgi:hypothetical protein